MKNLKKPKIWLIILAILHTGPGVIIPYVQMGGGTEHLATILIFLCLSVYILYVAFMTKGQIQARLSVLTMEYNWMEKQQVKLESDYEKGLQRLRG